MKRDGKHYAHGRRREPGKMSSYEKRYADHLNVLQNAGSILWWKYESLKLRLADNTFYTPDFAVMLADGSLECHEVKGYWEDKARVKIKVAADLYPLRFLAFKAKAKKLGGGWEREEF